MSKYRIQGQRDKVARQAARATHPSTGGVAVRRAAVNDLRQAIEQDEFVVHFQRQVALDSGRVVGFEALVRRQTADGLVPPSAFIRLAEQSGLIVPLGRLILERACEQLTAIHRRLPHGAVLPWVAVNFSARQLESPAIVDEIQDVLAKTGLDPDLLWIEITETAFMEDLTVCATTLRRIRALGVHLSIDDFGTGCSSLKQVKLFPIEQLKIDRSFTAGLGLDEVDTRIVMAIIALAHSLGLHVVAEGVETAEQRDHLLELGCDVAQGYLWGKALPFEQAAICPNGQKGCYNDRPVLVRPPRLVNSAVTGPLDQLSPRSREVVCRLVRGERVPRIADAMFVTRSTVRNHLSRAFREFGVSNQSDLLNLFHGPPKGSHAYLTVHTPIAV